MSRHIYAESLKSGLFSGYSILASDGLKPVRNMLIPVIRSCYPHNCVSCMDFLSAAFKSTYINSMSNNRTNNDSSSSKDTGNDAVCSTGSNSNRPAVAVIGAGPAGLACAQTLLDLGYKVDIYEMSGSVGGMARSCEILGQTVDLGPHRFHTDEPLVKDFWAGNLDSSETVHKERLSRILYKGKFFSYPLRGFEALFQLGLLESARCVLSYAKSTLFPRKEPTFEAWVSNAFGHRLYEIFFKTYSEKLWGIKCSELSDQFARERIRTLNLSKAVIRAFIPDRGKKERTLVSTFIYPAKGAGQMWNNTLARIMRSGGVR